MEAILSKIYNVYRLKNYNMIIFGTCNTDPLLKATDPFFSTTITSHIVLASKDKRMLNPAEIDTSLPYIDVAMM